MENTPINRRFGISHFFIAIGILLLSTALFAFLAEALTKLIFDLDIKALREIPLEEFTRKQSNAYKFSHVFTPVGFIMAAIVCAIMFRKNFLEFSGLKNKSSWIILGLSLIFFGACLPLISALIIYNGSVQFSPEIQKYFTELEELSDHIYGLVLKYNTGGNLAVNLLVMSILPAIGEEIFFRGILMRVAVNATRNIHIGIVISALIFAGLHLQPFKFLPMVALAMLFSYIYYRSGSLWIPILLHAVNNAMVVIADWYTKTTGETSALDNDFSLPPVYFTTSVVFALGALYLLWKNSHHTDFTYE